MPDSRPMLCCLFNGVDFFPEVIPPLFVEIPRFHRAATLSSKVKGSGALNCRFWKADSGGMGPEHASDYGVHVAGQGDNGRGEKGERKQPSC